MTQAKRNVPSTDKYNRSHYQTAVLGEKLGCRLLYNCDGGGSSTLWWQGATYFYAQITTSNYKTRIKGDNRFLYGPRPVAEAIYFTSLEK